MKYRTRIIPGFYPNPSFFLIGNIANHHSKAVARTEVFLISLDIKGACLFANIDLLNAKIFFSSGGFVKVR